MKALLVIIMASLALSCHAQRKHYTLNIKAFCFHTTGDGEDEIYAIIAWRTSDGERVLREFLMAEVIIVSIAGRTRNG